MILISPTSSNLSMIWKGENIIIIIIINIIHSTCNAVTTIQFIIKFQRCNSNIFSKLPIQFKQKWKVFYSIHCVCLFNSISWTCWILPRLQHLFILTVLDTLAYNVVNNILTVQQIHERSNNAILHSLFYDKILYNVDLYKFHLGMWTHVF